MRCWNIASSGERLRFAFDSLYINGRGNTPDGHDTFGLWRCRSSKGDGEFDKIELLREWKGGGGDHGAHAILINPDQKHLNVLCGNFVDVPDDVLKAWRDTGHRGASARTVQRDWEKARLILFDGLSARD